MAFTNSVVGGVTLVRPAIQSPNFVSGTSGWEINVDGSAEFADITIRGSGTADPLTVGPSGGPQVIVRTTPTNGLIVFPTNTAIELDAATLNSAVVDSGAADEKAELQMTGPTVTGATDGVRLVLASQPDDGTLPASFSVQTRDGATTFFAVDETEIRFVQLRMESEQAAASGVTLAAYVVADTFDRFRILGGGDMEWGSGSGARDVTLYRDSADTLKTDDTFLAANMRAGRAQAPAPGGTPAQTSVSVTYAAAMPGTPRVVVTPNSASADLDNTNIRWAVTNESSSGFDISCWRDTNFATNFDWVAISDTE